MNEKESGSVSRPRYLRAIVILLLLGLGATLVTKLVRFHAQPTGSEAEKHAWQLVVGRVEAGVLMDIHLRGSGEGRPLVFDNAQDAALDHFKGRLQAGRGHFFPRRERLADLGDRCPELDVTNPEGAIAARLKVELPRGDTSYAQGATLWALALPSQSLYRLDLKGKIRSVVTPEPGSEFTVYTLVTPVDSSFVATRAY